MLITSKLPQLIILFSVYLLGRYLFGVDFIILDSDQAQNLIFWGIGERDIFVDERGFLVNIFGSWFGLFKVQDGLLDIEFGPWGVIGLLIILLYPVIFSWVRDAEGN
jgi:hypothetical protein